MTFSEPKILFLFTLFMAALLLLLLWWLKTNNNRAAELLQLRWLKLLFVGALIFSIAQLPTANFWWQALNTSKTVREKKIPPPPPSTAPLDGEAAISEFLEPELTHTTVILYYGEEGIDFSDTAAYLEILAQKATAAKKMITVTGHTDHYGLSADNHKLGMAVANRVANKLEGFGVPQGNIIVTSAGENQPVATNTTEEGRRLNRRVEIRVE